MRKLLLPITLLVACANYAQSFYYGPEGMTDYVVVSASDKKAEELYTKTKAWVMDFFSSPEDVIKVDIPNKKLRFLGSTPNEQYQHTYQIEVEFKDGRYKFDPVYLNISITGFSWDINMNDGSAHYNNKGKMRALLDHRFIEQIPSQLNEIEGLLYEYIASNQAADDDW